uniref:Uncharacterized protein n=1 Tax=Anopheles merus TaxID=30066 RepID=A0A182UXV7_ANOME
MADELRIASSGHRELHPRHGTAPLPPAAPLSAGPPSLVPFSLGPKMPPLMGVTAPPPPPPPPDAQCCLPLNLFGSRMFSTEKANRFEAASLSVSRMACGFVSPPLSMERVRSTGQPW